MKGPNRSPEIRRLQQEARRLGYTVLFVDYCEDASTPGLIGALGGVCDYERKQIKVATRHHSKAKIAAILSHELEHAAGAEHGTDYPEHGLRCGGGRQGA